MLAWLGLDRTPAPSSPLPMRVAKPSKAARRIRSRRGSHDDMSGAISLPPEEMPLPPPSPSSSVAVSLGGKRRVVKGRVQRAPRDPLGIPTVPPPVVAVPQSGRAATSESDVLEVSAEWGMRSRLGPEVAAGFFRG